MSNVSQYLQEGELIDYTPVGAVTAGKILQVGALSVFSPLDIAAGKLGAVAVKGVIRGPYVGGALGGIANVGDNVWWDANGSPLGGTALSGSFTCNAAAGDWWVGTLVRSAAVLAKTCDIALNKVNPNLPAWTNRVHETLAADHTLDEAAHSGGVTHVTADVGFDTAITLPNGVVGMEFIIQNDQADGGNGLQVIMNAGDSVRGCNLTLGAGATITNTLATSVRGDYLHLVCTVAATAWRCVAKRGIWA
jgi:predicted RecA/RadA family phage recombinase